MLKQAAAEKLIMFSPAETIEKLTVVEKEVDILTLTEANNMFIPEMKSAVPLLEEPGAQTVGLTKKAEKKSLGKFVLAHELAVVANMTAAYSVSAASFLFLFPGRYVFHHIAPPP